MKGYMVVGLTLIALVMSGCGGENNESSMRYTEAPDTLADVTIKLFVDSYERPDHYLNLYEDGTATSYYSYSSCCWEKFFGTYTYEKDEAGSGKLNIHYDFTEYTNAWTSDDLDFTKIEPVDLDSEYTLFFLGSDNGEFVETPSGLMGAFEVVAFSD